MVSRTNHYLYLNGEDLNACNIIIIIIIMPQSVTCFKFVFPMLHFSVKGLVEDLNKEPEGNSVQIAVEETRGQLRAALPLSGDSYFSITRFVENILETDLC